MFGDPEQINDSLFSLETAISPNSDGKADIANLVAGVFVIGPPTGEVFFLPSIQRGAGVVLTTDGFVVLDYSIVANIFDTSRAKAKELLDGNPTAPEWANACKDTNCTISIGGVSYSLDIGFLAVDDKTNMALIKAYMPGVAPAPSGVIFSGSIMKTGDPVTLLGLTNYLHVSSAGRVIQTKKGSFLTNIPAAYDYTHEDYVDKGAFVTPSGKLAGVPLIFQFTDKSVANGISAPLIKEGIGRMAAELRHSYESSLAVTPA